MSRPPPIPPHEEEPDQRRVVVRETFDPLVVVEATKRIRVAPAYHAMGYTTAADSVELRTGALNALHVAANSLPTGMCLLIWDGLRSLRTQREIIHRFAEDLRRQVEHEHEVQALLEKYVSPLPESLATFTAAPPPHATGGAVDVTLSDESGRPLDLGAAFDQFDRTAWLTHYERSLPIVGAPRHFARRRTLRRTLYWSMIRAGFAPYPWEFWHFEFGTRRAAAFHGMESADYGPAVPFELGGEEDDLGPR